MWRSCRTCLARLRTAHPQVDIELELSNAVTDLLRRDADVAVRMVRPKQEALLARRVGRIHLGLHAHRNYLDAHATPVSGEELAQHTLIGFDRPPAYLKSLGLPAYMSRDNFAYRADSDLAQLAAIRAGFGIGMCQYGLARRDAGLVALLSGAIPVTWTLQDVLVGFGGAAPGIRTSLSGSFVYDADLDLYSDVNITSPTGLGLVCLDPATVPCNRFTARQFLGVNYNLALNVSPTTTPSGFNAIDGARFDGDLTGDPLLALRFAANLTNLGGVIGIASGGAEFICISGTCPFDLQSNLYRPVIFSTFIDSTGQPAPYLGRIVGTPVPEPHMVVLFGVGLMLFVWHRRQRRNSLKASLMFHRGGWDDAETERVRKIIEEAAEAIARWPERE